MKIFTPSRYLLFIVILFNMLVSCDNPDKAANEDDPLGTTEEQRADTTIALELMAEGFTYPLTMVQDPSGRFYMVDQIGIIRITDAQGNLQEKPFLNIRNRMVNLQENHDERGLLGLALHPDFPENGKFYIHYSAPLQESAPDNWSHTKHLSEFKVSQDDPLVADPGSERILMRINEPQTNHNGGTLTFGPDGYLYLGLGDGGAANDVGVGHVPDWYERNEGGNGQDREQNLLGSIIRIDVDNGDPYAIPSDNPFTNGGGLPEQYATGFRNPYRFSFDRGNEYGMIVGDVGQKLWEEINIVEPGGNYGWNVMEGYICFNADSASNPLENCPEETPWGAPLLKPILVFPHEKNPENEIHGIAIIGGNVYRGNQLPEMNGQYFFGTWTQHHKKPAGAIFSAENEGEEWKARKIAITNAEDGNLGRYLTGFAEDNNGELYILTSEKAAPVGNTGKIYKMVQRTDYQYKASQDTTSSSAHSGHSH